jgi:hypothetical protein
MLDKCLICLEDSDTYIMLRCRCKNICHENCFKEYIFNTNKDEHMINNKLKCLICKSEENILLSFGTKFIHNSFLDSFLYSMIFIIQNFYFYLDKNYFPENLTFFRIIFALFFHFCLILVFLFPYLFTLLIIYINYSILLCKKPYKIHNL